MIYVLILFYGSYFIHSNFYLPIICNGITDKNEIALTFDDGPNKKNTLLILDVLKQNNLSATFFCIGKKIKENPLPLKRIDDEGHLVGNHSYSHHYWFDLFSTRKMIEELKATDEMAEKIIHKKLNLFRPPYGVTNPNLAKAIKQGKYIPIGWSVRTMDTTIKDEKILLQNITCNIKQGDIFLFHDTQDITAKFLQSFINNVKQQGFEIVRLDKLLKLEAYE